MKQYQSETINDLATALAKAQADMTHASKDAKNPHLKSKYADLSAVIDAARPHLAKNGLSVVQPVDFDEAGQATLLTQLIHASGQWIRSWYPIRPVKNDPQGFGSALTYARRYSYASIVGVAASGEDDDGNAASARDSSVNEKKEPDYNGTFESRELLDKFVANSIQGIQSAASGKDVVNQKTLNLARWDAMKESPNPVDREGFEKIALAYNTAFMAFKIPAKVAEPKTVDAAKADLPASVAADAIQY